MPEAPASYFATGLVAPNQPDVTGRRGDFYTTRVGSERAHALLRQPRHGSRAWYCPFTLASGSDPRHGSRVALTRSPSRRAVMLRDGALDGDGRTRMPGGLR